MTKISFWITHITLQALGMDLKNIEDAVLFNNIHEGQHLGYIMAQKRAIIGEMY